jgi:hypothetical protein
VAGPSGASYLGQAFDASSSPMLPGSIVKQLQITLPRAGRVYATGHARLVSYCASGDVRVRLHFPEQGAPLAPPIAGSERVGRGDVASPGTALDTWAITGVLQPGSYTLLLTANCDGSADPNAGGQYQVGALLLAD